MLNWLFFHICLIDSGLESCLGVLDIGQYRSALNHHKPAWICSQFILHLDGLGGGVLILDLVIY